jgi:hypothetical protein
VHPQLQKFFPGVTPPDHPPFKGEGKGGEEGRVGKERKGTGGVGEGWGEGVWKEGERKDRGGRGEKGGRREEKG